MGKVSDALRRALENGGKKTTVGGFDMSEYGMSKADYKEVVNKKMNEKGNHSK